MDKATAQALDLIINGSRRAIAEDKGSGDSPRINTDYRAWLQAYSLTDIIDEHRDAFVAWALDVTK